MKHHETQQKDWVATPKPAIGGNWICYLSPFGWVNNNPLVVCTLDKHGLLMIVDRLSPIPFLNRISHMFSPSNFSHVTMEAKTPCSIRREKHLHSGHFPKLAEITQRYISGNFKTLERRYCKYIVGGHILWWCFLTFGSYMGVKYGK